MLLLCILVVVGDKLLTPKGSSRSTATSLGKVNGAIGGGRKEVAVLTVGEVVAIVDVVEGVAV